MCVCVFVCCACSFLHTRFIFHCGFSVIFFNFIKILNKNIACMTMPHCNLIVTMSEHSKQFSVLTFSYTNFLFHSTLTLQYTYLNRSIITIIVVIAIHSYCLLLAKTEEVVVSCSCAIHAFCSPSHSLSFVLESMARSRYMSSRS